MDKLKMCPKLKGIWAFILLIPRPCPQQKHQVLCPESTLWPSSQEVPGVRGFGEKKEAGGSCLLSTLAREGRVRVCLVLCCLPGYLTTPGTRWALQKRWAKERSVGQACLLVCEVDRSRRKGGTWASAADLDPQVRKKGEPRLGTDSTCQVTRADPGGHGSWHIC